MIGFNYIDKTLPRERYSASEELAEILVSHGLVNVSKKYYPEALELAIQEKRLKAYDKFQYKHVFEGGGRIKANRLYVEFQWGKIWIRKGADYIQDLVQIPFIDSGRLLKLLKHGRTNRQTAKIHRGVLCGLERNTSCYSSGL